MFGAIREGQFYAAPCKVFADDAGRTNTIRWYEAPAGALIYEEPHVFTPGIDRAGDPLSGLYEYTAIRTNERRHFNGLNIWGTDGLHVHGDADDYLGRSLAAKYGPTPINPCGAVSDAWSRILIRGRAIRFTPTAAAAILISGSSTPSPAGVTGGGVVVAGGTSDATAIAQGRFVLGGIVSDGPAALVGGGVTIGGITLPFVGEIGGGIVLHGGLDYAEGRFVVGGVALADVGEIVGGVTVLGVTLPATSLAEGRFVLGGRALDPGNAAVTGGITVGGSSLPADDEIAGGIIISGGLDYAEGRFVVGGGSIPVPAEYFPERIGLHGETEPDAGEIGGGIVLGGTLDYANADIVVRGETIDVPLEDFPVRIGIRGETEPAGGSPGTGIANVRFASGHSILMFLRFVCRYNPADDSGIAVIVGWLGGPSAWQIVYYPSASTGGGSPTTLATGSFTGVIDTDYVLTVTDDGVNITASWSGSPLGDISAPTALNSGFNNWMISSDEDMGIGGGDGGLQVLSVDINGTHVDTFTDANGTAITAHVPDVGAGAYTQVVGGQEIQSGSLVSTADVSAVWFPPT